MKQVLLIILAACSTMFAATHTMARAGPFGVEMGAPISDYDITEGEVEGYLVFNNVPKKHPLFVEYGGQYTDQTGICAILAVSDVFENDAYGRGVKQAFNKIHAALAAKYGDEAVVARLEPGALWDEPREWVMSIFQSERVHRALWESSDHPLLPHLGLYHIHLSIKADSSDSTQLVLVYRGSNFRQCQDTIDNKNNSAL